MQFVYPPTLDWSYMFQRPQQLARALAARGHSFYFAQLTQEPGRNVEAVKGDPGVFLVHDWAAFERTLSSQHILFASWAKYHALAGRCALTVFDSLDAFPCWEELEAEMVRGADMVLCTSAHILDRTASRARAIHLVPNACDFERWQVPRAWGGSPRRVLFCGYLGDWLDWPLFEAVIRECSELQFVIAGARGHDAPAFVNVIDMGTVEYAALPALAATCQAAIIPFDAGNVVAQAADPIKLYEYMAAGLPIVSTPIREVEKFAPWVATAPSAPEFAAKLREAVHLGDAHREGLRMLASGHTWPHRALQIEQIIQEALAHA